MRYRTGLAALAAAVLFSPLARAQQSLLWIPGPEEDAEQVIAALESSDKARLTAAFGELPKKLEDRARKLQEAGRLELALRPAGDPPLPLLYYPASDAVAWAGKPSTAAMSSDQYFLPLRLSLARDAALKRSKTAPAGLVSPPGGIVPDYFPLAKALGIKWIACGVTGSSSPVAGPGGTLAVPFTQFSTAAVPGAGAEFILFDETSAADPAWLRAMLTARLLDPGEKPLLTVSEALQTAVSTAPAAEIQQAAPWSGDYSAWASAPLQAGALAAMRQTREALMLHLNSLQGNYAKASQAFGAYFAAENASDLRALASADPEVSAAAETGMRLALADSYRLMRQPPPTWAFSGLSDADTSVPAEDKITAKMLPDGFIIKNAARPATPPAATPGLPADADPARIWKLESLKVSYDGSGVTFRFKPAALDNSLRNASGFSHVRIDLYMDVNHRPRAGITMPLEGRPYRLYPENAWEYALEVTPAGAALYKITPRGKAVTGRFKAEARDGAITVSLPSSALRGSPGLWSYAALMLAPDGNAFSVTDYLAEDINRGYIYAVRPGRQ